MAASVILPFVSGMVDNLLGFASNQSANKQNLRMNRENLAAARQMQELQMSFQKDMYEDAKEYNSPISQRMQYEKAGLNPYAMMTEGSFQPVQAMSGASGSVPGMNSVQSYQPNFQGAVSSYFDSRIKEEQVENLRYQNDMKELSYQTELQDKLETIMNKRVKTEQDWTNLKLLRQELEVLQKTKNYRISQARADANKAQAEFDSLDWNNFWTRITSSLDYAIKNNEYNISTQELNKAKGEIAMIWQNIANLKAEGRLTEKMIKKTSEEITSVILKNEHDKKAYPKLRRQIEAQIRATNRFSRKQGPFQLDVHYNENTGEYEFITPGNSNSFGVTRHR